MASPTYDIDVARARIERVFRYLAELHRIRTPPALDLDRYEWILRLDALPRHPTIQRGFAALDASGDGGGEPASRSGFIVSVERPTETECPAPSVLFENWLEPGWDQPGVAPAVAPTRPHRTTDREESFEDKEERVLAFEDWLDERRRWEASESQVVASSRLFSELFTLWGKFERESEKLQLFVGDGVLVASHAGEPVRHPLLLQRVQLEFDAHKPRFTIRETGDPPDLYAPLLRYLDVDPRRLLALKDRVAADEIHPLGGKPTSEFLQGLVQTFWQDGMYFESPRDVGKPTGPYVYRQPAFYLGNRNQGFADTIERYIEILPAQHGAARGVAAHRRDRDRARRGPPHHRGARPRPPAHARRQPRAEARHPSPRRDRRRPGAGPAGHRQEPHDRQPHRPPAGPGQDHPGHEPRLQGAAHRARQGRRAAAVAVRQPARQRRGEHDAARGVDHGHPQLLLVHHARQARQDHRAPDPDARRVARRAGGGPRRAAARHQR